MAAKQVETSGTSEQSAIERFRDYLTESKAEIRKVTWPTKQETKVTSLAVVVLVIVMAIFLGLVDLGFTKLVAFILSPGA